MNRKEAKEINKLWDKLMQERMKEKWVIVIKKRINSRNIPTPKTIDKVIELEVK